jgi:hypothetical protein
MEKTSPISFFKQESVDAVSQVLSKLFKSEEKGDIEALADCFLHSNSVVHIGTDMDEYFTTWRDYLHWVEERLINKKDRSINEKETRIYINDDDNTAWYSQMIDTCYETKGEITRLEGFRHTGVLIKTQNGWKIVQSHISAPTDAPQ